MAIFLTSLRLTSIVSSPVWLETLLFFFSDKKIKRDRSMQRNVVNVSYYISDFDFDLDYIVYMIQ